MPIDITLLKTDSEDWDWVGVGFLCGMGTKGQRTDTQLPILYFPSVREIYTGTLLAHWMSLLTESVPLAIGLYIKKKNKPFFKDSWHFCVCFWVCMGFLSLVKMSSYLQMGNSVSWLLEDLFHSLILEFKIHFHSISILFLNCATHYDWEFKIKV